MADNCHLENRKNQDISKAVWPTLLKFCMLTLIGSLNPMGRKNSIFKMQDRPKKSKKNCDILIQNGLTNWPICTKFGHGRGNLLAWIRNFLTGRKCNWRRCACVLERRQRQSDLLQFSQPLDDACHTRLTTGGGGVLPRSRYRTPGPISDGAVLGRTLWPDTSRRYRLERGRLGEVTYERPPDPVHRLVLLLWIWTWGAAHLGLATSSEDRHRVGLRVMRRL